MAAIVGEAGLAPADRRAMAFAERFERELVAQGSVRRRLVDTIELGWTLLETLPREDLLRISEATWSARHQHG
jgi:V/A-type H+-transporting ATPase subunit B